MQLFISYAHTDTNEVRKLVEILRQGGHQPWFDEGLKVGRPWQEQLRQAIEGANAFVYVLTPDSVASEWCQWEFVTAIELGKPIIPVLLKETQLPVVLSRLQFADFRRGATKEAKQKLLEGLAEISFVIPPQDAPPAPAQPSGKPAQARVEQNLDIGDVSGTVSIVGNQTINDQTNIRQQSNYFNEPQRSWSLPTVIGLLLLLLATIALVIALLPSAEKDKLLYSVGLISASKTPTLTPTATLVPTIAPTPLVGPTAVVTGTQREILVLIAKFEQISGNPLEPDREWEIILNQAAQEIGRNTPVRVLRIPTIVMNHEQARNESEIYKATLVIWGNVRGAIVESHYTITPRGRTISTQLGSTEVQGNQEELSLFVSLGGDSEYVLNFVLAQLSLFGAEQDAALPFLDRAIELKPVGREKALSVDSMYFYRAYLHQISEGDLYEIIEDYDQTIAINPENAFAFNNRAVAYSDLEDYYSALEDYDDALVLLPNSALIYNNRGVALAGMWDFEAAINDHTKAIELRRNNYPEAFYNRGIVYAQRGLLYEEPSDFERAIDDYIQAIDQRSNYPDAYNNLAIAYVHLKDFEKAIENYNQAISLNPDDAKFYCNRSKAYESVDNQTLAAEDAEKAISLDPDYDPSNYSFMPLCQESEAVTAD